MKIKHLPIASGIYSIKNTVNGKMYIGSSGNIQQRARKHLHLLRKQKHSRHLQNAWNLYGEDKFKIIVLTLVPKEKLIETEQFYLDDCRPFHGENGYNSSTRADRCVHTPESKEKLRLVNVGKKYSKETNLKKSSPGENNGFFGRKHDLETRIKMSGCQPFFCVETGEVFYIMDEAAKQLDARGATISDCLKGKRKISNGLHFSFVLDRQVADGHVVMDDREKAELVAQIDQKRKLFRCTTDNELFSSVNRASFKLGIPRYGISDCLSNKISQTHGLKFFYV